MSHKRKKEDNRRLKKLYDETKNWYGAGAYYNEKKNRYIKYSCHNTWLKSHCQKMIRRKLKNDFSTGISKGGYKKFFDYWWELL